MSANDPTLADMMQQVASYKAGVTDASNSAQTLDSTRAGLASANALLYGAEGQDNAAITTAANTASLQTEAENQKAVTAFGTDINDQSSMVSQLGATAQSALTSKMSALATINQKKSVSFLDDPMQWVSNQFTINDDVKSYNAANETFNSSTEAIDKLNQMTQSQIATNKQNAAPITAASAAAAADLNVQQAQVEANNAQSLAAGYSLDAVGQTMKYTKEAIDANFSAQQLKNAVINTSLAQQRLQQETLEWPMRVKLMQDQLDNVEGQRAVGQGVINDINTGIAASGGKRPLLSDNEGKAIVFSLKSKSPLAAEYATYMKIGQQTSLTATQDDNGKLVTTPVLGTSPANLYSNLSSIPTSLDPHLSYGMDVATQAAQTVASAADNPNKATLPAYLQTVTRKDPQSINTAINQTASATMANYQAEIKPTDPKNPYNFGDINSIAALPAVTDTDLYKKVFAAPISQGVTIPQDKAVEMTYQAFKSKTISSAEAAQLSTILTAGMVTNNQTRNFAGLGYAPASSNNLAMQTGKGTSWGAPVTAVTNFADSTSALTAFTKRLSNELTAQRNYSMQSSVPATN